MRGMKISTETKPKTRQTNKKPRKNQEVLDFIEKIKKQLQDENPKNFGLYMKLYKQYGKQKMQQALAVTLKKKNSNDKLRYFIALLVKEERYQIIKEKYNKLKSKLLRKLTPKYQRISQTRSRLYHKIAKEERRNK